MIKFEKYKLKNGLTVILHPDKTSQLVAVNTLYKVGARNEEESKTGFAHLFEHLMFGGSENIPDFDTPLQERGGENNAFTNNDITNYYITIPASNIETAFWLESDRMLQLAFSQESLDVQKNVVKEEFKQRYLNQPYGDLWLELRPLAYKTHPYKWATIGKDLDHIEKATLTDVKDFFYKYYRPNNAVLVVSGNFEINSVKQLIEKWYSGIPAGEIVNSHITEEPPQTQRREKHIYRDVPLKYFTKTYPMVNRNHKDYVYYDLLSDVLSNGNASRFDRELIKTSKGFISADAFITGSYDNGLFILSARLTDKLSFEKAEEMLDEQINLLLKNGITDDELSRITNMNETSTVFNRTNILNKAMDLAFYEFLGDANLINDEYKAYQNVKKTDLMRVASNLFDSSRASVLKYDKIQKHA